MYPRQEQGAPRVKDEYSPLFYQWGLHLLSALSTLHSRGIAYGDLITDFCWLSSPTLSLSLAGFTTVDTLAPGEPDRYGDYWSGGFYSGELFLPFPSEGALRPTFQTDIFSWATVVYEMIVSTRPGDELDMSEDEIHV
jgi:hypothetical protein